MIPCLVGAIKIINENIKEYVDLRKLIDFSNKGGIKLSLKRLKRYDSNILEDEEKQINEGLMVLQTLEQNGLLQKTIDRHNKKREELYKESTKDAMEKG